jgi:hypothetical protein
MHVIGAPLGGGTVDLAFVMPPNALRTIGTLVRCGVRNSRLLVGMWLVSNSILYFVRFRCMVMANELAMNCMIVLGKKAIK